MLVNLVLFSISVTDRARDLQMQILTILIFEKFMSPFSLLLGVPSSMNARSVK